MELKGQDYYTASVQAIQPLFTGGKLLAGKRAAHAKQNVAKDKLALSQQKTTKETVQTYFTVSLLEQVVNLRENVLDGIKEHQRQAESLVKSGVMPSATLLRANVAVAEAERNLISDRNHLETAKAALRKQIGAEEDAELLLLDTLNFQPCDENFEFFVAKMEISQPILQQLKHTRDLAKQGMNAERADYVPTVVGFGRYEFVPEDLSVLEPRWAVGISASLTVFDGTRRTQEMQVAKHRVRQVEYTRSDVEKSLRLLIEKNFRDMRSAEAMYFRLAADIDLAEENLRQNTLRFNNGVGTSLDVIDVRLALERAQLQRLSSLYDYTMAWLELSVASGDPAMLLNAFEIKEQ